MRTHPIENYQTLRDSAPCLSRAATLPKGTKLGLGKRRAPGNTIILSQPYRRRVSTDRLNREGSQLAASLEGEPGPTPAGKTLPHSFPETSRFRRERARCIQQHCRCTDTEELIVPYSTSSKWRFTKFRRKKKGCLHESTTTSCCCCSWDAVCCLSAIFRSFPNTPYFSGAAPLYLHHGETDYPALAKSLPVPKYILLRGLVQLGGSAGCCCWEIVSREGRGGIVEQPSGHVSQQGDSFLGTMPGALFLRTVQIKHVAPILLHHFLPDSPVKTGKQERMMSSQKKYGRNLETKEETVVPLKK